MSVYKNILNRRTIRLFKNKKISKKILEKLVNAGRLAASARNLQPLEYLVINDGKFCDKVFHNIIFGGEIEKFRKKENRPVAYILILVNKNIRSTGFEYDAGLAVGNIVLTAWELGIGACIMGAIERGSLIKELNISPNYYLDLVIAFGYPAEKPKIKEGNQGIYWRDKKGTLWVSKKPLPRVLHWNKIKK